MTEQRPVRERLRELADDPFRRDYGDHLRVRRTDMQALLDELDTLERRVRAAESRLADMTTAVKEYIDSDAEMPEFADAQRMEPAEWNRLNRRWAAANTALKTLLSEARSLISGTKEPTDG